MTKVFSVTLTLALLCVSQPAFPITKTDSSSTQMKEKAKGNTLLHGDWYSCKAKCGICGCSTELTEPTITLSFSSIGRLTIQVSNNMFDGFFVPIIFLDKTYKVTGADTSLVFRRAKKVYFTVVQENEEQLRPHTLTIKHYTTDGFTVAEIPGLEGGHKTYCKYIGTDYRVPPF
jgi:hypothetical protein